MKINNSLLVSAVLLSLMATGCVKKEDSVAPSGTYNVGSSTTNSVYDTTSNGSTTTYGTADATQVYTPDTATNTIDYSGVVTDNTVITTGDTGSYGSSTYGQTTTPTANSSYGSGEIVDNYNDSQSSGAFSTNSSGGGSNSGYSYGGYSSSNTSYSDTPSYSNNSSSYSSSSSSSGGGISLQIAALKDYYAAEEFKKSLSLDPKYSVYIKRGALNKVIITGISSVNDANRLKERRFPGAFIVHDNGGSSSSYSSSYSSYSSPASSSTYSDNSSYGSYSSYSSSSSSGNSIGVQLGAFSKKSQAQSVANAKSRGKYKAIVKQIGGLYKVILTGFKSSSSARAYAKRVGGFIVHY